jgi:hypothetical protein
MTAPTRSVQVKRQLLSRLDAGARLVIYSWL